MSLSSRLLRAALLSVALYASAARADEALVGPRLVRLLGDRAQRFFAPNADVLGALVTLPPGVLPEALGLEPFAPGFARLHVKPADLVAYADAHPDLYIEVAPPLHPLLNMAGQWIHSTEAHETLGVDGAGVLVGVADTGLDVTLADFKDPATGKSRVAWILDLSLAPAGIYPELEKQFCTKDGAGKCAYGAVLQGKDIDALDPLTSNGRIPIDEDGHGTHVTSIAAGNGGPAALYVGAAPAAQIVFARVADSTGSISTDSILTGASFIFNRADAMNLPVAVNVSIGTDFGPHDGSLAWEKALASYVGESSPGHAMVIAAGNSGSITYYGPTSPIHQSVHVTTGTTLSLPIPTAGGNGPDADVEVWVTFTSGSSVSVGLDGPDGTWIAPVSNGQTGSYTSSSDGGPYTASIVNGSTAPSSQVPMGSNGAVIVWTGQWPSGACAVTLQGEGNADLWVSFSAGIMTPDGTYMAGFQSGVREGTVSLPATQAGLIAAGCTVNRTYWTSIGGLTLGQSVVPALDDGGSLPVDASAPFVPGQVCWFSGAGPTVTGVPKPEISAPGAYVVAAMSSEAPPGAVNSIFTDEACPANDAGVVDPRCLQVDPTHGVAQGTSMSAPMVTGAIALLFERNPTLTETQIVPILQGGAHYFRAPAYDLATDVLVPFEDEGGPGELDILGSFQVMDQMSDPVLTLPSPCASATSCKSWITLSTDYVLADGSTPTVAIVELRTAGGTLPDLFEPSRLRPAVTVDGLTLDTPPTLVRRGPGVWFYSLTPPAGFGGQSITFGANFDGVPIVIPRTLSVATDPWTATSPSQATGSGCTAAPSHARPPGARGEAWAWGGCLGVLVVLSRRRTRRITASRMPR